MDLAKRESVPGLFFDLIRAHKYKYTAAARLPQLSIRQNCHKMGNETNAIYRERKRREENEAPIITNEIGVTTLISQVTISLNWRPKAKLPARYVHDDTFDAETIGYVLVLRLKSSVSSREGISAQSRSINFPFPIKLIGRERRTDTWKKAKGGKRNGWQNWMRRHLVLCVNALLFL